MASDNEDIFFDIDGEQEKMVVEDDSLPDFIKLIHLLRDNPLLWNSTNPEFRNRDKKDMKWKFIGSLLTNTLSGM